MLLAILVIHRCIRWVVLVMIATGGAGAAEASRPWLTLRPRWPQAPAAPRPTDVDVRKQEVLSTIPWLNRMAAQAGGRASNCACYYYQANLKWTTGGLVCCRLRCLFVPGYLVYLRTEQFLFALLVGCICWICAALICAVPKRSKRFKANLSRALPRGA